MLQAIECLYEFVNMSKEVRINIARWLIYIDMLFENAIKKCILDVKLT